MRAATLLAVLATASGTASYARPKAAATIVMEKMAFGPAPAVLRAGETVEWVNNDIFQHTATARDGSFDVVIPPHRRARVTLRNPGVVEVYCRFHPGMKVVLKVGR